MWLVITVFVGRSMCILYTAYVSCYHNKNRDRAKWWEFVLYDYWKYKYKQSIVIIYFFFFFFFFFFYKKSAVCCIVVEPGPTALTVVETRC